MPKSGRPSTQQAPKESTTQPTKTENSILIVLRKIVNHPIVSIIGLIPFALVYDALRGPDISSDLNADASQPFAFPFVVKNNSSWLNMQDAVMYCVIKKIGMTKNRSLEGFTVASINHATIGPEEIVNFRCIVAGASGRNIVATSPWDILDAHINIFVEYTMLGVLRASPRTEFTWYTGGAPPHWIKGRIVD